MTGTLLGGEMNQWVNKKSVRFAHSVASARAVSLFRVYITIRSMLVHRLASRVVSQHQRAFANAIASKKDMPALASVDTHTHVYLPRYMDMMRMRKEVRSTVRRIVCGYV
jgi:hypothetical protein